jgi:hypothetical protein
MVCTFGSRVPFVVLPPAGGDGVPTIPVNFLIFITHCNFLQIANNKRGKDLIESVMDFMHLECRQISK